MVLAQHLWARVSRNVLGWIQAAKRSFNSECGTWCFYQHTAKGFPSSQACMVVFLKLEDSSGFWMSWEFFLSQVGWSHVLPVTLTWNQNPSFHLPTAVILTYLFQLLAFFISSCWEDQVDTFFWIICCWIVGFYCILYALSLWTSELLQRLKILSLDSCSFGRYCICRKIARKHSKFYIL